MTYAQTLKILGLSSPALALFAVLFVVGTTIETWWQPRSGQGVAGRLRNLGYALVYLVVGGMLVAGLQKILPVHRLRPDNPGIPFAALTLSYLIVWDATYYWYHRAQHRLSILWPIHELHHADAEMNVTTGLRAYPLERPIQYAVVIYPSLLWMPLDPRALMLASLILIGWEIATHANVPLSFGPLDYVLCSPAMHRRHHARDTTQVRNYAQMFTCIDLLFGTLQRPPAGKPKATGTPTLASDASIVTAMLLPFRRWFEFGRASRAGTPE